MPIHRFLIIVALCGVALVTFFGWNRATITVVPASPIDRITIDAQALAHQPRHVTDPQHIATIIGFLHQHDKGWYTPFDTYPGPEHTLTFYQNDQLQYVIWLGPNWLGYRRSGQIAADNLMTNVPEAAVAELRQLLGIKE